MCYFVDAGERASSIWVVEITELCYGSCMLREVVGSSLVVMISCLKGSKGCLIVYATLTPAKWRNSGPYCGIERGGTALSLCQHSILQ